MIGFILTRHVNSKLTNKYWIECVKQIRQIYKNNIIMTEDQKFNHLINHKCTYCKCEYIEKNKKVKRN